jgi:hypothetical protein
VRIDAGHLRRTVSAQAQQAPGELINELEGLQIQRRTGAAEQGLKMLKQGWHHQFVAVATRHVEQIPSEFFNAARLGGQDIGNVIG